MITNLDFKVLCFNFFFLMKQLIHYIFCPTSLENQFLIEFSHRMPIIVGNLNLSLSFLFPKMQACNAVLQI